jgi:hypothetical protein
MSHDIACRITLFPPVRTVLQQSGQSSSLPSPGAAGNLELLQAAQTIAVEKPWIAYIYFIAHTAKSVRDKQEESGTGANTDNRTRNCPETKQIGKIDQNAEN